MNACVTFWESWVEIWEKGMILSWYLCLSGSMIERQCIKLEIWGSILSLGTHIFLSVFNISSLKNQYRVTNKMQQHGSVAIPTSVTSSNKCGHDLFFHIYTTYLRYFITPDKFSRLLNYFNGIYVVFSFSSKIYILSVTRYWFLSDDMYCEYTHLLLLLPWRYSPFWALASILLACLLHPLIPSSLRVL